MKIIETGNPFRLSQFLIQVTEFKVVMSRVIELHCRVGLQIFRMPEVPTLTVTRGTGVPHVAKIFLSKKLTPVFCNQIMLLMKNHVIVEM